ncbi:histidine kinase [Marinomonas ushuaiensis DSM 15871]|uniref:histidine kinase n=1 Tax=Marinomonas ushuaiensis DSM 15871 TaxID=1122207 RepID=X7EAD5_9GAMM|nr:HAMP domain-containing sensor histidine kinase [Marinomonas ushuaiensis]ETX12093.1 histidine kinase [Marinomonas ushuaiensis DSM 15871]
MRLLEGRSWLLPLKQWMLYIFIFIIISVSIAVFGIITYTSDNAKKNNSRRVFESALWNALQLQIQSYRFQNYLVALDSSDYPLNGTAFFEYDLLMSRVDLLRESDVGSLIKKFEGGRTTRLLNIINGELELLSFNLSKIEAGDPSYLPDLIDRIQKIEGQMNEFISLVNKGSNAFISNQHQELQKNLSYIQLLSLVLFGCLCVLCFITIKGLSEFKKTTKSNKELRSGIQSTSEDKANLVALINQEIRSPINSILSIANTLKNEQPTESSQELSKHIKESGRQLIQTIEILSDLTLIDTQKMTLTSTVENLQESIENILAIVTPQLSRKDLKCVVYIDPALPEYISVDFVRIKEIIIALLQNAITYTPSGSISVQVRASSLSAPSTTLPTGTQEARMLQIAIRDTGIGMPSQLQQHLRANPSLPIKQKESIPNMMDLSLTLCHKLVYLMKGEIDFSSTQQGSEFWIDIPFNVPDNNAIPQQSNFKCTDKKQALLIEKDAHLATIIGLQLALFNIDVTPFKENSFDDENHHYDLVILGDSNQFEFDKNEAFLQWRMKGSPILSYHFQSIDSINSPIIPLHFPLLQNQLDPIISTLFGSNQDTEKNKHD